MVELEELYYSSNVNNTGPSLRLIIMMGPGKRRRNKHGDDDGVARTIILFSVVLSTGSLYVILSDYRFISTACILSRHYVCNTRIKYSPPARWTIIIL